MKNLIYVVLSMSIMSCHKIQTEKSMKHLSGYVADDPNVVIKVPLLNTVTTQSLPVSYFLVCPTPRDQGNEGACVPFASGYAARSIELYYASGATSYSDNVNLFSPEYIYDQTKINESCFSGTSIGLTMDLMKNKGTCLWSDMPYIDNNGCSVIPTALQDSLASAYKIYSYDKIVNTERATIKSRLATNHPVVISLNYDDLFYNANSTFIWNTSGTGTGPHTVCVVGYDDSKNAYRIMNSWGTGWGDGGFSWIDYNFFENSGKIGYYVYTINVLPPIVTPPPPLPAPETYSISVSKVIVNRKVNDIIAWNIALNNTPQSAQLQVSSATTFNTFYTITPYTATGSNQYNSGIKKTRYYRLKLTKSDGSIVYSSNVSIL